MTTEKRKQIARAAKVAFGNILAFSKHVSASAFNRHSVTISMIMVVEDEYWVVSPADAQRLNRLGHHYATR